MVSDINLKEIQRRVYMTFFQDGLWDIFLGLFILGWGLSILTEAAYLPGISFLGIYFVIWGIKKWLTYPRIGYVRFSATSRRRITARFLIFFDSSALAWNNRRSGVGNWYEAAVARCLLSVDI